MKLNELLSLTSLDTFIVFKNAYSWLETEPKMLDDLIKLPNFVTDSQEYEVKRVSVIRPDCLHIEIASIKLTSFINRRK